MSASVGYGRLGYNVGAWNKSPDSAAVISGQLIQSSVNFGEGWGRESWSEGAWNSNIGLVITGTGQILSITGQQLNTAINSVVVTADTINLITGQQLNTAINSVTITADTINLITGKQATISIGTYAIAADGTMTIVVPEFEITSNVGITTTGTSNSIDITSQVITSTLSNVILLMTNHC